MGDADFSEIEGVSKRVTAARREKKIRPLFIPKSLVPSPLSLHPLCLTFFTSV